MGRHCVTSRGLVIALLVARPLRIRNFQAITIGKSLRWDGARYWLTFGPEETKTGGPINEPIPDDLIPYLEAGSHWELDRPKRPWDQFPVNPGEVQPVVA